MINVKKKYKITLSHKIFYFFFVIFIFLWTYQYGWYREKLYSIHGHALLLGSVLSLLVLNLKKKYTGHIDKKGITLFVFFNVWSFFLAFWQGSFLTAYVTGIGQILILLFFFNVVRLFNLTKYEYAVHICNMLIILSVVSFIIAIYLFLFGRFSIGFIDIQSTKFSITRLTGWYGSPNNLGPVFGIAIFCTIFMLSEHEQNIVFSFYVRSIYYIILVLNILGLLLTGSRGTWLACVVGLFVIIFFRFHAIIFKIQKFFKIIMVVVFLSVSSIMIMNYMGYDWQLFSEDLLREKSIEGQLDFYAKGSGRMYYWKEAFILMENADYKTLLFGYKTTGAGFMEIVGRSSHSGYLAVLVDRGLIAMGIFLALIVYVYMLILKNIKHNDSINIFSFSAMSFLLVKNATTVDIPWNTFAGISFIMFLLLIFMNDVSIGNNRDGVQHEKVENFS